MPRPWTVAQHGAIERLEDNLWSVSASGTPLGRRMTIVRLSDRRLVIYSCIALDDASMRELEAWGEVAFIVVPNGHHRLDAHAYKARYPQAKLICAADIAARVRGAVQVDGNLEDLPREPGFVCERVPGTSSGECALQVTSHGRVTLVLNDLVFNHPHSPGFAGWLVKQLGSTGGPRVTFIARRFLLTDVPAARRYLEGAAATPGLARVIVSHVETIDHEPARQLREIAGTLS